MCINWIVDWIKSISANWEYATMWHDQAGTNRIKRIHVYVNFPLIISHAVNDERLIAPDNRPASNYEQNENALRINYPRT